MQASAPQSHLRLPLTKLLGGAANLRVLRSLALYGGPLSVTQLARETGLTPKAVRETLGGLQAQLAVNGLGQSRAKLYEINPTHPLASSIAHLFTVERDLWTKLQGDLRRVLADANTVVAAWYYGSVARGTDGPGSDLDIAVVLRTDEVEVALEELREALHPIETGYAVSFSVVGISTEDVRRLAKGDAWWLEVARDAQVLKGKAPEQLARSLG